MVSFLAITLVAMRPCMLTWVRILPPNTQHVLQRICGHIGDDHLVASELSGVGLEVGAGSLLHCCQHFSGSADVDKQLQPSGYNSVAGG